MKLVLLQLVLVLGWASVCLAQGNAYGYLPPDRPLSPDESEFSNSFGKLPTTQPPRGRPITEPPRITTTPPPRVTPPRVTPPRVIPPRVTPPRVTPPRVTPPRVTPPSPTPPRVTPPRVTPPRPTQPPQVDDDDHHHHHDDHHHHHHGGDPLDWLRDSVPGEPGDDYPIYWKVPETGFTCDGRGLGFYADTATRCQAFHICQDNALGQLDKISFLCPNGTIFDQELFTCMWWNEVDCSTTETFYRLNELIGIIPEGAPTPRPTQSFAPRAPAPQGPVSRPQPPPRRVVPEPFEPQQDDDASDPFGVLARLPQPKRPSQPVSPVVKQPFLPRQPTPSRPVQQIPIKPIQRIPQQPIQPEYTLQQTAPFRPIQPTYTPEQPTKVRPIQPTFTAPKPAPARPVQPTFTAPKPAPVRPTQTFAPRKPEPVRPIQPAFTPRQPEPLRPIQPAFTPRQPAPARPISQAVQKPIQPAPRRPSPPQVPQRKDDGYDYKEPVSPSGLYDAPDFGRRL